MDLFHDRPYPGRVLIGFWCDSDHKKLRFFTFHYFSGYFSFAHFGRHQNLVYSHKTPALIIS